MTKLRICNACGWAHFPRSRQEVEDDARAFGDYIQVQTPEVQAQFGFGPLSPSKRRWTLDHHIHSSERCFRCSNPHTDFRDELPSDNIPTGCTLQGIIKD